MVFMLLSLSVSAYVIYEGVKRGWSPALLALAGANVLLTILNLVTS